MYIIHSDAGQPLREELAKSPQKILARAFPEFLVKSESATTGASTPSSLLAEGNLVTTENSDQPSASGVASSDAYFQGLQVIKTLVKLIPGWLQSNRMVFDTLVLVWKSPARISRLQREQELDLVQVSRH